MCRPALAQAQLCSLIFAHSASAFTTSGRATARLLFADLYFILHSTGRAHAMRVLL